LSGAVGNPFTASMFRSDGVIIAKAIIKVNRLSDNNNRLSYKLVIDIVIYFYSDEKKPHIAARCQEWMVDFGQKKSRLRRESQLNRENK